MKGLKALRSLPVEKHIKTAVKLENENNSYYRSKRYYAYSAYVTTAVCGEVLVVCLYGSTDKTKNGSAKMSIIERHFLSESGEIAAERYLSDDSAQPGKFTITASTVDSWELSNVAYNLAHETQPQYYIPNGDANEVIFEFAKKHRLYEPIKKTFYTGHGKYAGYTSGLCWLAAYQIKYKAEKADEAKDRLKKRTADRMNKISGVPNEFNKWIRDETFSPAAWFYKFKKRVAEGRCGACGEMSSIPNVKHSKKGICPRCGRPIQYISIKNGNRFCRYVFRTTLVEQVSENEFASRYFEIAKSYGNRDFEVDSEININEMTREFWCVKTGEIVKTGLYNAVYDYCYDVSYRKKLLRWERVSPRYGVGDPGIKYPGNIIEITRSLAERLDSPVLRNMDLRPLFENNANHTPTRIFEQAIAVPSIESMAKMGLSNLANTLIGCSLNIKDVLDPVKTGSPAKQLGVDKLVLEKFAEINITLDQYIVWHKLKLSLNDFEIFRAFIKNYPSALYEVNRICKNHEAIKFGTAVRYLEKQREKYGLSAADVVMYWSDYLMMARQSGFDLEHNRDLLYPESVKKEHDRLQEFKEILAHKELNEKLALRAEILENLEFSDEKFVIFPLRNSSDFLNESNVLNHCVKTYTERCADGRTNIFGLRKIDEPDNPYFTVNIDNNGRLIQNRGKNNCAPPKNVTAFVNKWLKFVEKKLKTMSLEPGEKNQIKIGA